MDETNKSVRELIREIVKDPNAEYYSIPVKITAVDETARTCDVEPLNGSAEIFDVRLQAQKDGATGFVLIPKVGSIGVVTFINSATGFLAMTTDIDKILIDCDVITFNGGTNDGLIKINDLITKLNAVENDLNTLKNIFQLWVPVPQDGGAKLKADATAWSTQTITPTQKTDLENTKIKH